jgi:hypothetical protein
MEQSSREVIAVALGGREQTNASENDGQRKNQQYQKWNRKAASNLLPQEPARLEQAGR